MKFFKILILFILFSQLFSQKLYKEPVAIPAPFELQQNIDVSQIIQPLAKIITTGDTTFYIRKDIKDSNVDLESVEFYKLFENDTLVVFAEVSEYDNGNVTNFTVTKIVNSLLYNTPQMSANPNKGILTNELELFGDIPDVDNNGKLFVLLIDVRDNYNPEISDTYVAGYFDPIDQVKSKGNYSDIIYIDTNPGQTIDDYTLGVVAHELQHLIHYNYDNNESVWLNEGFSELAPILLGYTAHSFSRFLQNTNRKLTTFDGSLLDYSKVGLWSFYFYKRFGIEAIKNVLRNSENSIISYKNSLNELGYPITTKTLLHDWFLANLLNNETIEDGKYSYYGEDIPILQSEYFHANFTEGKVINGNVKPESAQYLQFNGGKNINLNMSIEKHSLASLAVIKHKDPLEIEYVDISSGKFNLEDLEFGKIYDKMSLVLSWTAAMDNSYDLEFSYSAVGVGGFEEIEYSHDDDTLNYYISLESNNIAAEKFIFEDDSEIAAIKFNCGTNTPVNLNIYNSLEENPIETYRNITSNYQEWTIFHLDEPLPILSNTKYYFSVGSATNDKFSLGYAETGNGDRNSFLSNGGSFNNLNNFSIDGGESQLDGNWLIRTISRHEIFTESELVLNPNTLIFVESDSIKILNIENSGTEVLNWNIESMPDFININQNAGVLSSGRVELKIEPNFNNIEPGIYNGNIIVNSNINNDSTHIILIKRNFDEAQTTFILPTNKFENNQIKMKVFNIGLGTGEFKIKQNPEFLAISPTQGFIYDDDTLLVDLRIDSAMVTSGNFSFIFDDGVNDIFQSLKYEREMSSDILESMKLYQTAPNPFIPSKHGYTNIMIRLVKNKKTNLKIINVLGQVIKRFNFYDYSEGLHLFRWNGKNDNGKLVGSGIYFIYLEQSAKVKIKKLLLVK